MRKVAIRVMNPANQMRRVAIRVTNPANQMRRVPNQTTNPANQMRRVPNQIMNLAIQMWRVPNQTTNPPNQMRRVPNQTTNPPIQMRRVPIQTRRVAIQISHFIIQIGNPKIFLKKVGFFYANLLHAASNKLYRKLFNMFYKRKVPHPYPKAPINRALHGPIVENPILNIAATIIRHEGPWQLPP